MKTSTVRSQELRERTKTGPFMRREVRIIDNPDALEELKQAVARINKKYLR